jgi:hypothetical protein
MSAHGRIRHPFCGTSIVPFDANGLGRPKAFESMPRCKARTSAQAIEKDFPHIVQMIVPLGGFGKKLDDMYEWHWTKDTEAMRGNGWRDDSGRFYVRWCFANLITAQDFARKFGGSIVKGR